MKVPYFLLAVKFLQRNNLYIAMFYVTCRCRLADNSVGSISLLAATLDILGVVSEDSSLSSPRLVIESLTVYLNVKNISRLGEGGFSVLYSR
jgi:hypothetical protein